MQKTIEPPTGQLAQLKAMIATAISQHSDRKARWKAMTSIRWCLHAPQLNLWAGLSERAEIVPVTSQADAMKFDGRDNEDMKLAYYTAVTGIAWRIQLCAS